MGTLSTNNTEQKRHGTGLPDVLQAPPNGTAPAAAQARSLAELLSRLDGSQMRSIYLHMPFCFHKCHYCDFYSIVDSQDRMAAFTDRLISEIRAVAPVTRGRAIQTIFVGGGTPTLMPVVHWQRVLDALHEAFNLSRLTEFTVEANPETVTPELLAVLAGGGVNRISMGAQSFNEKHLKTLERWHDPRKVGQAMGMARDAGIDNINLDLIFAIPTSGGGQTLDDWQQDLDTALSLSPRHLSCYSLMYEPNTPLTKKLGMGQLHRIDEDLEAAMYEHTIDTLKAAGFEHYEISNWARKEVGSRKAEGGSKGPASSLPTCDLRLANSNRCLHNLAYWLNHDWLALGPSASGHVAGVRWKNVPHLGQYLASTSGGDTPIMDVEQLDAEASIGEQIMLRIRLIEGIDHAWLDAHLNTARRAAMRRQIELGFLESTPTHVRLTRKGLLLADTVAGELL